MFSIQQLKDTGLQAVRFCFWTTALLSYLKLTLTCLIRLLWSRSSYPRNCYHCVFTIGIGSLSLWRNFLLHVWQRLFHLLPFFSCQVCWSFWRSVKGCGRLVLNNTLPKILPYSSESPAVGFCVLPQMPDKWLLSGTEKHQTSAGRKGEIPEEQAGDTPFINTIYIFYNGRDRALALRYWQWHHQCICCFF